MKIVRVFFRTLLCSVLPLCLLMNSMTVFAYTGNSSKDKTAGTNLRVMSFNTLVDNDEENGGWSWGQPLADRGEKGSACIEYYQPDVIGLQECNYNWHVALKAGLPDYAFVNADVPEQQHLEKAESLGKKDWMCTTMMYNTKTLTLIDNELIGYSVNYWGCIQRMRYISMAIFEIRATGERFVFTSTHLDAERDSKGQTMRKTQAGEMATRLNYYKDTYGYPIISTGDFNSGYTDEPLAKITGEVGMSSHPSNRGGIDFILFSTGISAKYFAVINDADANGASDHKPIIADLAVENYRFATTTTTEATTTTTTTTTDTTTTDTTGTAGPGSMVIVTKTTTTAATATTATTGTTAPTTGVTGGGQTTTSGTLPQLPSITLPITDPTDEPSTDVTQPTDAPSEDEPVDDSADEPKEGLPEIVQIAIGISSVLVLAAAGIIVYLIVTKKKQQTTEE